jgi:hypothetical protein
MANPSSAARLLGPLPRRDILAVCAFLNRKPPPHHVAGSADDSATFLDRLAAAARMQ